MVQAAQYWLWWERTDETAGEEPILEAVYIKALSCGGQQSTLCIYTLSCALQDRRRRMYLLTQRLMNRPVEHSTLLCCQHLRDGNLLMLLATRISIRAPFMWSPRFTCVWNTTNVSNYLEPLESNSCSLLLAFILLGAERPRLFHETEQRCILRQRRDQRLDSGSFPEVSLWPPAHHLPALASLLVAGEGRSWLELNRHPDGPGVNY